MNPTRHPKLVHPFCLVFVFAFLSATARAADQSGEWEFTFKFFDDVSYARVTLTNADGELTGKLNELNLKGTVKNSEISFNAKRPNGDLFGDFKGTVLGDSMEGTGVRSGARAVTWSAKRPATPPAAPRVLDFEPKEFHRVFSDAIPPVLHIFPGDTVRTWTVDAGGVDSKGVRRSPGGNPQTGPFYIEGAFPGDTLVVTLVKVRLNRDHANSGNQIVPTALTPGYLQRTKYEDFDANWTLDREKGIARLRQPSERLKNYTIKLQPMLGCVAVAPPQHQSFRTGYLGPYGGNLDYNQIREGTTVYLPVFTAGALLFVGDGHAVQGDGELNGDALETSMDVEFTVNLLKNESVGSPRAENEEYFMSLGIANSLSEALQAATSDLATWVERSYKLKPNESAVVLGTSIQYNVAEVVDPLVHVVAKIRKNALDGLK